MRAGRRRRRRLQLGRWIMTPLRATRRRSAPLWSAPKRLPILATHRRRSVRAQLPHDSIRSAAAAAKLAGSRAADQWRRLRAQHWNGRRRRPPQIAVGARAYAPATCVRAGAPRSAPNAPCNVVGRLEVRRAHCSVFVFVSVFGGGRRLRRAQTKALPVSALITLFQSKRRLRAHMWAHASTVCPSDCLRVCSSVRASACGRPKQRLGRRRRPHPPPWPLSWAPMGSSAGALARNLCRRRPYALVGCGRGPRMRTHATAAAAAAAVAAPNWHALVRAPTCSGWPTRGRRGAATRAQVEAERESASASE